MDRVRRYVSSDDEFLATCGTVGLGRLLSVGDPDAEAELRIQAADRRWRVREAAAMALQRLGRSDRHRAVEVASTWAADPSLLVRRAAVAALCEPFLVATPEEARQVLAVLDGITADLGTLPAADRTDDSFRVLRQALGYGWSVALVADPDDGFARLERWATSTDGDILWIVSENLSKRRLRRADPDRAAALTELLHHP